MIDLVSATVIWIALPLVNGFFIYLFPTLKRFLGLGTVLLSLAYGLYVIGQADPLAVQLLDSYGVSLRIDELSGFFIVTNALVSLAVLIYCLGKDRSGFFYTQLIILHGSINAIFICADFMSLYVALEVVGIAAFLLISSPRTNRSIWIALRYLFVSNTVMLFYLVGAALVYKTTHSFAFTGLTQAPAEAIALILVGLFTKGGIFVSGLWLPLTHGESETPISAMLSGVVVKAGVFPLVRCALMMPEIEPVIRGIGVATALFGVGFAIFEQDAKRVLAYSTISQLGLVLAAPEAAGFYALTHGLGKGALFLSSGQLPTRHLPSLEKPASDQPPLSTAVWGIMAIAGLSISGAPLLAGFGAKTLTSTYLVTWQEWPLNIGKVGTALIFAKFIFLPHKGWGNSPRYFYGAIAVLLAGLLIGNGVYPDAYTLSELYKPLIMLVIGWGLYWVGVRGRSTKLSFLTSGGGERLEHLIGVMSLAVTAVFWWVQV